MEIVFFCPISRLEIWGSLQVSLLAVKKATDTASQKAHFPKTLVKNKMQTKLLLRNHIDSVGGDLFLAIVTPCGCIHLSLAAIRTKS